jgi:hypothetical protein
VIGEYKVGANDGARVIHSDDYFATANVRYTAPTTAAETHHIHAVHYDSEGVLWVTRGDNVDQIGYSDDDGATWTWLLDASDHSNGVQGVGMCDTPEWVILAVDDIRTNKALCIHKELRTLHPFDDDSVFHQSFRAAGKSGGDLHGDTAWACATLPTGDVLLVEHESTAGQKSSISIMSPDGLVHIRLEDFDDPIDDRSAVTVNSQYAFVGDVRVPSTLRIARA